MPTKKRRIGFIPRFDVLRLIDNISEEEKLSNSKVVSILIEEALYSRGLLNEVEKSIIIKDLKIFMNKISDLQKMLNDKNFIFDEGNEEFMQSKNNTKLFKRFIQFLYFKKMMNIFEELE